MRIFHLMLIGLALLSSQAVLAASETALKEDKQHVQNWNVFVDHLLDLHKRQIKGREIKTTESVGGYANDPEFYREIIYRDKATGKVLSKLQWELENSNNLHSIQVNIYDKHGRLVRDYSAAYLPRRRNAPVQTLINLHGYNDGLHAFRQFDGSKDVIYEYCEGEYNGKDHQIRLFEDDIVATDYESRQFMKSPIYKACFGGIKKRVGKYIKPQ
jgi:hypothetical protein